MILLDKIFNRSHKRFLSSIFRKKRLSFFHKLISGLEKPVKLLDVGGNHTIWKMMQFKDINVIILNNPDVIKASLPYLKYVAGDARDMSQFKDKEFDLVFSNSVIEHVGSRKDQKKMADEIRRVGKRYFIQTPNRYFPIEPHFLFPFFQFLPLRLSSFLLMNFDLGFYTKASDYTSAVELIKSINLLDKKSLLELFPEAKIYEEIVLFFTKSFTAYYGWK